MVLLIMEEDTIHPAALIVAIREVLGDLLTMVITIREALGALLTRVVIIREDRGALLTLAVVKEVNSDHLIMEEVVDKEVPLLMEITIVILVGHSVIIIKIHIILGETVVKEVHSMVGMVMEILEAHSVIMSEDHIEHQKTSNIDVTEDQTTTLAQVLELKLQ